MTRSNAAHEPSMDEILASIRRIIETGDEKDEAPASPPVAGRTVERVEDEDARNQKVVARVSPPVSESGEAREAPVRSFSDFEQDFASSMEFEDDLAARLHEELNADDSIDWASLAAAASNTAGKREDEPNGHASAFAVIAEMDPRAIDPQASDSPNGSDADETPGEGNAPAAQDGPVIRREGDGNANFAPANSDSRRMDDYRAAVLDDHNAARLPDAEALTSGRTGDLVSASFEELADAIRDGQMRSLEEMTQDLLRPMLQEWLDDNLPKLVERLVREEIERVARGGRR